MILKNSWIDSYLEENMANYISEIQVKNFKKFQQNSFELESGINVLVGNNDVGKSSLLKAIDIVLNQSGTDDKKGKYNYGTLMNKSVVNQYLEGDKSIGSLPKILIEVSINLDDTVHLAKFNGMQNLTNEVKSGITFSYEFDDIYGIEYEQLKEDYEGVLDFIPFEFYKAKWQTFAGQSYSFRQNPLKSILIDTDKSVGDSYSNYTSQLFAAMERTDQYRIGINLKTALSDVDKKIHSNYDKLGVDVNRLRPLDFLEAFSDVGQGQLPVRDMGSGMESTIKTELALTTESKLVLVEEPENHLAFSLARRQIDNISKAGKEKRQVVVTTHSPLIVNRLSLSNVRWLQNNGTLKSFSGLDQDIVDYFIRLDNVDLLQVLLSPKLIVVEGPTEYILMENMIKAITGQNSEKLGIHIMSMRGDHFKRFVGLVKETSNKVLIITDNDSKATRITDAHNDYQNIYVAMPKYTSDFTFEVALYEQNKEYIDYNDDFNSSSTTDWHSHKGLSKKLVYLLNNKVDSAIKHASKFLDNSGLQVPDYIKEGIEWLIK